MNHTRSMLGITLGIVLSFPASVVAEQDYNTTDRLIEQIVQDVVGRTLERAREEVQEHTGIDPLRRGFEWDREHPDYPAVSRDIRDDERAELRNLGEEYDREIAQYERELERELSQARREFSREAAKEERQDKILDKRRKLERKVDAAYDRFREKVRAANRRYDERRSQILYKDDRWDERGRGEEGHRGNPGRGDDHPGRGRGPVSEEPGERGRGNGDR